MRERDRSLRAIDEVVAAAGRGEGRALLIEGHAGMGKTRLHEAALDRARATGLRVLRATGAELERNLALGVATQLLDRLLAELPPASREAVLADAPEQVRLLAGAPPRHPSGEASEGRSLPQAIFSVIAAASESAPTLVAVDDLHCTAGGSSAERPKPAWPCA